MFFDQPTINFNGFLMVFRFFRTMVNDGFEIPQTKRLAPWQCTSAGAIPRKRLSDDLPPSTSAQAFQVLSSKALHQKVLGAVVEWLWRWRQPRYFDAPTPTVAISSSFWNNQHFNARSAQHCTTVRFLKTFSVNYTVRRTDRFHRFLLQRKLFVKGIIINWDG